MILFLSLRRRKKERKNKFNMEFYDIHTHQIYREENDDPYHSCIFDVYPLEFEVKRDLHARHAFSCGIHPWYSEDSANQITYLSEIASDERIIAIGETGLDKLKGPSFDVQMPVFKSHITLSERLNKPIIIHCVKAWEEIIKIKNECKPANPWIIHGYRGKPELTKRLIKEGFYFSMGESINVESVQLLPPDTIFCETDESEINLRDIYLQVAHALNLELEEFAEIVANNVKRVFPTINTPKGYPSVESDSDK